MNNKNILVSATSLSASRALLLLFLLLFSHTALISQIGSVAVPFLILTSSPETNGLGGIATLTKSDDPVAMFGNAGSLGIQSLSRYGAVSTFAKKTQLLPDFRISDFTYSATAVQAGLDISKITPLPFPMSFGVGYVKNRFDYGKFIVTGNDPIPISQFDAFEESSTWYVGIGFEYFVRGGFGLGFKNIQSSLAPFEIALPTASNKIEASAHDLGVLLEVPFGSLISPIGLVPLLTLNVGYGLNNIGDGITYSDQLQKDPLPREVQFGLGAEIGYQFKGPQASLTLLSLTIAREARDLLVNRQLSGAFSYESGFGEISIWDNVLSGHVSQQVVSRKGWQLNFLDTFFLRRGSFGGGGFEETSTSGFGFKLSSLLNIVRVISEPLASSTIFGFIAEHVDFQYHYSSYEARGLNNNTQFKGLVLIIH